MAVKISVVVFWVVILCGHQSFGGMLVSTHKTTQCHIPGHHNQNKHNVLYCSHITLKVMFHLCQSNLHIYQSFSIEKHIVHVFYNFDIIYFFRCEFQLFP
jgi:hypothetical protein